MTVTGPNEIAQLSKSNCEATIKMRSKTLVAWTGIAYLLHIMEKSPLYDMNAYRDW